MDFMNLWLYKHHLVTFVARLVTIIETEHNVEIQWYVDVLKTKKNKPGLQLNAPKTKVNLGLEWERHKDLTLKNLQNEWTKWLTKLILAANKMRTWKVKESKKCFINKTFQRYHTCTESASIKV